MSNSKQYRNPFDYFVEKGSDADPFYQSILELDKRLNEERIPHILRRLFDGWQIVYPSEEKIDGDIISHFGSYGREQDLLEAYGFNLQDAEGWLTVEEALNLIKDFDKSRKEYIAAAAAYCSHPAISTGKYIQSGPNISLDFPGSYMDGNNVTDSAAEGENG